MKSMEYQSLVGRNAFELFQAKGRNFMLPKNARGQVSTESPSSDPESECYAPLLSYDQGIRAILNTYGNTPVSVVDIDVEVDATRLHGVLVSCPFNSDGPWVWDTSIPKAVTSIVDNILKKANKASRIMLFKTAIDTLKALKEEAFTDISANFKAKEKLIRFPTESSGSARDKWRVDEAKRILNAYSSCHSGKPGNCNSVEIEKLKN